MYPPMICASLSWQFVIYVYKKHSLFFLKQLIAAGTDQGCIDQCWGTGHIHCRPDLHSLSVIAEETKVLSPIG